MKKILIISVILLAIAVPFTAFAAASDAPTAQSLRGFWGIDSSKLTDQHKADLINAFKKLMETKKEIIKDLIESGSLTKEQGDVYIQRIDDMIKYREENGFFGGFGLGRGYKGGRGWRGYGRGYCPGGYLSN